MEHATGYPVRSVLSRAFARSPRGKRTIAPRRPRSRGQPGARSCAFMNADELEAGLSEILASPTDDGVVSMIVRRPDTDQREVLDSGELDVAEGLVGDNWRVRGSRMTADGSAHPEMQLNLMNTRVIALVARSREHWALAGDQFFVRPGPCQGEPSCRHPACHGVGDYRGDRGPAPWLPEVHEPVRARSDEVRELEAREGALPSGHQREGR